MIARITATDEDERMPPADKGRALEPRRDRHAPRSGSPRGRSTPSTGRSSRPSGAPLPKVAEHVLGRDARSIASSWPGSSRRGSRPPRAPAARRSLRRASLDLLGLPPDARGDRGVRRRPVARRLREARRSPARLAALRRALGPPLARRRPLRRLRRLRDRHLLRPRLALSRLRDPLVQRRQALRPLHQGADRRRRALPARQGGAARDRALHDRPGPAGGGHGRGQARIRPAHRLRRHDRLGVPRPDARLRPLPRPQVRSDLAEGVLRPAGDLRRQRSVRLRRRRHARSAIGPR